MQQISRSNFQAHPFHLVSASLWINNFFYLVSASLWIKNFFYMEIPRPYSFVRSPLLGCVGSINLTKLDDFVKSMQIKTNTIVRFMPMPKIIRFTYISSFIIFIFFTLFILCIYTFDLKKWDSNIPWIIFYLLCFISVVYAYVSVYKIFNIKINNNLNKYLAYIPLLFTINFTLSISIILFSMYTGKILTFTNFNVILLVFFFFRFTIVYFLINCLFERNSNLFTLTIHLIFCSFILLFIAPCFKDFIAPCFKDFITEFLCVLSLEIYNMLILFVDFTGYCSKIFEVVKPIIIYIYYNFYPNRYINNTCRKGYIKTSHIKTRNIISYSPLKNKGFLLNLFNSHRPMSELAKINLSLLRQPICIFKALDNCHEIGIWSSTWDHSGIITRTKYHGSYTTLDVYICFVSVSPKLYDSLKGIMYIYINLIGKVKLLEFKVPSRISEVNFKHSELVHKMPFIEYGKVGLENYMDIKCFNYEPINNKLPILIDLKNNINVKSFNDIPKLPIKFDSDINNLGLKNQQLGANIDPSYRNHEVYTLDNLTHSFYISPPFISYEDLLNRINGFQNSRIYTYRDNPRYLPELKHLVLEYFHRKLYEIKPDLHNFRSLNGYNYSNVPFNQGHNCYVWDLPFFSINVANYNRYFKLIAAMIEMLENKPSNRRYLTSGELKMLNLSLGFNDTFFNYYNPSLNTDVTIENMITFIDKRIDFDRDPRYINFDAFSNFENKIINWNIYNADLPVNSNSNSNSNIYLNMYNPSRKIELNIESNLPWHYSDVYWNDLNEAIFICIVDNYLPQFVPSDKYYTNNNRIFYIDYVT